MPIRADIDKQDLLNVERDTRKLLNRAIVSLCVTASLLVLIMAGAGVGFYLSLQAIMDAAARGNGGIADFYQEEQARFIYALVSAGLIVFTAAAAFGVYRARRRLSKTKTQSAIKDGLSVGRFDYMLSDKHLIIKGPLKTKKIAWTLFTRMEDTKSSIVFWREDGGFEFIPKNVLPENITFERLYEEYQPRIEQALPFEEALYAKPLTVTFELLQSDRDEYQDYYHRRLDGWLNFARRVFLWRPAPSFLFLSFSLIAGDAFRVALRSGESTHVAIGAAFLALAVSLFVFKSEHFRGGAYPFQKDGAWPFAQSNLTRIALSKEAVFWRARGVQQIIPWGGFDELVECPLTAYLVITPSQVIALPKRAFISAKHYHAFIGFANSRLADANRARNERKRKRLTKSFAKTPAPPAPAGDVAPFPAAAGAAQPPERAEPAVVQNVAMRMRAS